jgi:hypothetical protein
LIKTAPGEIITPQRTEEPEWEVYDNTDVPNEDDVAKCTLDDTKKLKEVCVEKGFSGFVYDTTDKTAYFRKLDRDEFLSKKKSGPKYKGKKTFVSPDPALMKGFRMRKAVPGEGLPQFKLSSVRGNLFVDFEIIFPRGDSLNKAAVTALKKHLPKNKETEGLFDLSNEDDPVDQREHVFLEDMDPKESEQSASHAYDQDDDDDERGGPGGAQGVQCASQ